jgi:hypothetical protein
MHFWCEILLKSGTKAGKIYCLRLEEKDLKVIWSVNGQSATVVSQMKWMAPQAATGGGCLFVLLCKCYSHSMRSMGLQVIPTMRSSAVICLSWQMVLEPLRLFKRAD